MEKDGTPRVSRSLMWCKEHLDFIASSHHDSRRRACPGDPELLWTETGVAGTSPATRRVEAPVAYNPTLESAVWRNVTEM
jgi:hypothetical protein